MLVFSARLCGTGWNMLKLSYIFCFMGPAPGFCKAPTDLDCKNRKIGKTSEILRWSERGSISNTGCCEDRREAQWLLSAPVLPSDAVVSPFTSEHPHLSVIYVTVTETLSNLGATLVLPHSSYGIGRIPAGWWQTPVCGALSRQYPKDVEHLLPFSNAIARSGHVLAGRSNNVAELGGRSMQTPN